MTQALKVLHIVSGDLWAGAEVQAFTLMSQLARTADTQVYAAVLNEGTLAERLQAAGVAVEIVDEKAVGGMSILLRLRQILRSSEPDVIHTHRLKENVIGSLANRIWCGVPCVRTVHGSDEHGTNHGMAGARRRALHGLDVWCGRNLQQGIIAVSEELGRALIRKFAPTPVVVIENGIDIDAIRTEQGTAEFRRLAPDATHVGVAGRLVGVKRLDLFLEMAALLKQHSAGYAWRFHVFGDGPLRRGLQERARQLNLSSSITFYGHRGDIATCIGGLDVLVNCSDNEGLPMTCLEALALGVPMVAHAVGGLRSVLPQHNLVFRHAPDAYRDAVLKVVSAGSRASNVQRDVLEKFSAERNAERIRLLYQDLIFSRETRRAKR